jgi:hypothetical protein
LLWNSIDALQHTYVRLSEFFNEVKAVVSDSLKTPKKFMLNVQRLESAIRAHVMDKDGMMNTFEGENLACTVDDDKISPLVWLLIEAIAAVGLEKSTCRVVEDHFCDVAGHDLLPSTVSEYRYKWKQIIQLECSKFKGAVGYVAPETEEVEDLGKDDLEDAWVDVCEKAEVICAVRMQKNGGRKRIGHFNPRKFRTLNKTFGNHNQGRKITNGKICWNCANNDSNKNDVVHSIYDCPSNRNSVGRVRGGAGRAGREEGRVDKVETLEILSQADQRDVDAYINDRDGYCSHVSA